MVVDDSINQALNRIADNQEELNETLKNILGHYNKVVPVMKRNADRVEEEMNETLKRIANHYDGVVPVMTRNAKRAEEMAEEQEKGFAQGIKNIFRPVEN